MPLRMFLPPQEVPGAYLNLRRKIRHQNVFLSFFAGTEKNPVWARKMAELLAQWSIRIFRLQQPASRSVPADGAVGNNNRHLIVIENVIFTGNHIVRHVINFFYVATQK